MCDKLSMVCRHETVFVNLKDKPDWLFELNPLGAVPVLQHKGHVVYESAVCAEFLEEAFPGSLTGTHDLLPSSPYERAAVRLLILKFNKVQYDMIRYIYLRSKTDKIASLA